MNDNIEQFDFVECIDESDYGGDMWEGQYYPGHLTLGKQYRVLEIGINIMNNSQLLIIIDDKKNKCPYRAELFKKI